MTWRIPVGTQEPVLVTTDKPPAAADIRLFHWVGGIPPVGGHLVRDLIGNNKLMKIKAIHATITNTGGVHTASQFMFYKLVGTNATIFCELIIHVDANVIVLVEMYDGASTALVDTNTWTYALPNIVLTGDFSFLFAGNASGAVDFTMLYEVYDE